MPVPRPARTTLPLPVRKPFATVQSDATAAAKGLHPNGFTADNVIELDKAESLRNIETLLEVLALSHANSVSLVSALDRLNHTIARK